MAEQIPEKRVTVKKKKISHSLTKEELNKYSKEELIDKILQLDSHNFHLKNLLNKKLGTEDEKSNKDKKNINFSKYKKRHILLKFLYLGWDFHGYVTQEDTNKTIEHEIMQALIKSCLIENRETSNYHRCGRTDKGVSAFSQVISLDIRSNQKIEDQGPELLYTEELPYPKILNGLLPSEIRILSWSPVENNFSARFGCKSRTYKYFFPKGNLNIFKMQEATQYLLGTHDFRNFCKMDVGNGVVFFEREIELAQIQCFTPDPLEHNEYSIYELTIKSQGFLWHQIRCIMGILLLIGLGHEDPKIILQLLDIKSNPRKPQYSLAHEVPLILFDCEFDNLNWYIDEKTIKSVIKNLQENWTLHTIKSSMIRSMLLKTEKSFDDIPCDQTRSLIRGEFKTKTYKSLMERDKCESLENRIQHYAKKQRIDIVEEKEKEEKNKTE